MATILFSTLTNGQTISFNPLVDVLRFDAAGISAASLQPSSDDLGTNFQVTAAGKAIFFPPGFNVLQFTNTNVIFDDGSRVVLGDNTTGTVNDNSANTLTGTAGADLIGGFGGNDTVNAGGGNDRIFMTAMNGSDGGSDAVNGGAGFDTVDYNGNAAVTVNLLTGTGQQAGGGISTLTAVEAVVGGSFADTLVGDANANSLDGAGGNDTLNGGSGNDSLSGREENDTLDGGAGNDNLNGGLGNDTFIFSAAPLAGNADEIADFQSGIDSIRLDASILTGLTQNGALNPTLFAAGTGVATTAAQRILYDTVTGNLNYDSDGTGAAAAARLFTLSFGGGPIVMNASDFTVVNGTGTATLLWSTLVDGNTYLFNAASNILNFDDASIRASDRDMLTWTGNDVVFSVAGKANPALNKTVHFTVTGGGRALTDANVTYLSGSKLLIGDNTQSIGNGSSTFDDAANTLTGTAGGDRFIGLGGNDTMNGTGNGDNDVFVLNNGALAFGSDTVIGGAALGDAIGVGTHPSILHGSTVDFSAHLVTSVDGTAAFSNIENAFGTNLADTFLAFDPSRVLTGLSALQSNFDFARVLQGYAGNDTFQGDSRDGYFELVTYSDAPSAVVVNLATGTASDGYDSNLVTAGIQPFTDTLVNIDAVQGSAFNDVLTGGGPATTFNGTRFEQLEGMGGNDTLNANGATNVRADYLGSPSAVTVNLATGTASDGWGGIDTLIGIAGVRGSNFNDTITGDAGNNFLEGRGGNDHFDGGAGTDSIFYSASTAAVTIDLTLGNSSLTGGQGTDTWVNIEGVRGGDFNDTLRGADGVDNVLEGRAGADLLDGRSGTDLVRYDFSPNAVNVNLATGLALDGYDSNPGIAGIQSFTDTLVSIERVRGSKFDDTLTGDAAANGFEGWAGNDTINGGTGTDTTEYRNSPGMVTVNLATGTASDGWGGTDALTSIENAIGSAFDDSLTGDATANSLDGGAGNDTLNGGDGNDTLHGGDGNDSLSSFSFGAAGNDTLFGDAGNDTLFVGGSASATNENILIDGGVGDDLIQTDLVPANLQTVVAIGGLGIDTYQSVGGANTASYTVADFAAGAGGDRIDVLALLDYSAAIGGYARSTNPFSAAGGYLRLTQHGLDTWLEYDEDGATGIAHGFHTAMVLTGVTATALTANNFVEGISPNGLIVPGKVLIGTAGNDTLAGGYFNDTLDGRLGDDTLNGGAGVDSASYAQSAAGVNVSLLLVGAQNTAGAGLDTLIGIENLTGSQLADTLTGNAGANVLGGQSGNDVLDGGAGNDVLNGDLGDDTLTGGAGNDTLTGGGGSDGMAGGAGDDTYSVNLATDTVTEGAGQGSDTVLSTIGYTLGADLENLTLQGTQFVNGTGNAFDNVIVGNTGNNVIIGGEGSDTLNGGAGVDTASFVGAAGAVTVNLTLLSAQGAGTDTLAGFENATGGDFNDTLTGSSVANVLVGGLGDDTLDGRLGDDTLNGGAGVDSASYAQSAAGVNVSLLLVGAQNTAGAGLDTLIGIENLTGSQLADTLTGNAGANVLGGQSGNDVLDGGAGNDVLNGDLGDDTLTGGAGNDTLTGGGGSDGMAGGAGDDTYSVNLATDTVTEGAGQGSDTVLSTIGYTLGADLENLTLQGTQFVNGTGNAFDNVIVGNTGNNVIIGGEGSDTLNGGAGVDTASFVGAAGAVTVNLTLLSAQGAGTDTLAGFENATGGDFNDTLTGSSVANVLVGGLGDDTLDGRLGDDTLNGGAGVDSASYAQSAAGVNVSLLLVGAQNTAGAGLDTLIGIENLTGSQLADTLTGNAGANVLGGQSGNDVLDGGAGNDVLNGDLGDDTLTGGAGNDTLTGGAGSDSMTGGAGDDIYSVNLATDTVTENPGGGIDTVLSTIGYTLGADLENLTLQGTQFVNGTGNAFDNVIVGNTGNNVIIGGDGNDTLNGSAGADTLTGGAGVDRFVLDSKVGADRVMDFASGTDKFAFSQAGIHIGDGDTVIDGVSVATGPGGFLTSMELVIVTGDIAGAITASNAAAAIGAAAGAYAVGSTCLFAVDNGTASDLFLFTSSGADAAVSAAELTLVGVATSTPATVAGDYLFVA